MVRNISLWAGMTSCRDQRGSVDVTVFSARPRRSTIVAGGDAFRYAHRRLYKSAVNPARPRQLGSIGRCTSAKLACQNKASYQMWNSIAPRCKKQSRQSILCGTCWISSHGGPFVPLEEVESINLISQAFVGRPAACPFDALVRPRHTRP